MPLIYVALLDEGTEVWRAVEAVHIGEDHFQILTATPPGERWQFSAGQVVRCEPKRLSGSVCIVAVEAVSH